MTKKLTYEELEEKVNILKRENFKLKDIEDALRTEKNKLDKICKSLGAGIVMISKDYKTIWANDIIKEIFGDVENKPCYSTYNQRDQICPGCGVKQVFETGVKHVIHEQKGADANGQIVWSQIIATPLNDREGNIESVLEVVVPITERKLSEKALKESEEKFKTLAESSRVGIWHISVDGYTIYANPAMIAMLGINSINDLKGQTYHSFFTPESLVTMKQEHVKRPENIASSYEVEIISKKGTKHNVIISGAPLFGEGGKLQSLIGTFIDITDRKQVEEELLRHHQYLEEVVNERTLDLRKINEELAKEIIEHNKAEVALFESEKKLRFRAKELEEGNIALKVLLTQREHDKAELEENILSNVKNLVMPYILKLKRNRDISEDLAYLNILESNLNEIISPFSVKLSSKYIGLTPKEIQIADLVRDGKQDKDIMEILNISQTTVKSHRQNIRKKLGIYGKRANLKTYLLSLTK